MVLGVIDVLLDYFVGYPVVGLDEVLVHGRHIVWLWR
jgi:hypothetical protein